MTRTVRFFAAVFASLLLVFSTGGAAQAAADGQARAQIPFGAAEGPVRVEGAFDTAEPAADAHLDVYFVRWHRVADWRLSADARECRSAFGHEGCIVLDVNKEQKTAEVKIEVDGKVVGTGKFQW